MEWIFRNQETVAARSKYTHQLSSSNNAHPIEYFVYCSMGTVKFELLSWFSIVRDVWQQHFSVLSQKTNNISVVSSHFHLYLRISALRLPTVWGQPREAIVVKMAPTQPLASRSFCLLAPLCDHRSFSNLLQSNTRAWYTLHQNDRLVPFLVFVQ